MEPHIPNSHDRDQLTPKKVSGLGLDGAGSRKYVTVVSTLLRGGFEVNLPLDKYYCRGLRQIAASSPL